MLILISVCSYILKVRQCLEYLCEKLNNVELEIGNNVCFEQCSLLHILYEKKRPHKEGYVFGQQYVIY